MATDIELTGGTLLATRRKAAGLSQVEVGKRVGVTQPTISSWENETAYPDPPFRVILKELFEIPEACWLTAEERTLIANARARAATGTDG